LLNTEQPEKIDIKKFWYLIMNNKQLFDLTSPPSAEFDGAQELLQYCNNYAKHAVATQNSIREKNITIKCDFGGKYQAVQKHPIAKNKDKHHLGSTIVNLIQKSVLEEPAMEGTFDADPVSLNYSCIGKEELLICGTCACFF